MLVDFGKRITRFRLENREIWTGQLEDVDKINKVFQFKKVVRESANIAWKKIAGLVGFCLGKEQN